MLARSHDRHFLTGERGRLNGRRRKGRIGGLSGEQCDNDLGLLAEDPSGAPAN